MSNLDLQGLLEPVSVDEFLSSYFSQKPIHITARSRERFSSLLPWAALNEILRRSSFNERQLRLVKEGGTIPRETYTLNSQRPFGLGTRYSSAQITNLLRDGATLIVNGIDTLYEPIRRLNERLELDLQTTIGTNLYAAWRSARGFDLHWDEHDVFVVQVTGRKLWRVFSPTVCAPVEPPRRSPRPTTPPVIDVCIESGDLLYIPRGWWHVAEPCDEPTIHLTVGIYNPTGLAMLSWLTTGLVKYACVRKDVPRFAAPEVKAQYVAEFRTAILKVLLRPDFMDAFDRAYQISSVPSPVFTFPTSASAVVLPEHGTLRVIARYVQVEEGSADSRDAKLHFSGQTIAIDEGLLSVVRYIIHTRSVDLSTLYERYNATINESGLRSLLIELVRSGMIVVDDQPYAQI